MYSLYRSLATTCLPTGKMLSRLCGSHLAERRTPGPGPHYAEGTQSQQQRDGSPSVPPMGERQRWSEAPHEQLVGAFRGLIQQERQKVPYNYAPRPPAIIIGG